MVLAYHLCQKKLDFLEETANSRFGVENKQYKPESSCQFAGNTGTEQHFELHMSVQLTKSRLGNSTGQMSCVLPQINCEEKKAMEEESVD